MENVNSKLDRSEIESVLDEILDEQSGFYSETDSEFELGDHEADLNDLEWDSEIKRGKRGFTRPSGPRSRPARRRLPRVKKTPQPPPRPVRPGDGLWPKPKPRPPKPPKRPIVIRHRRRRPVFIREPVGPCVCPTHGTEFVRWVQSSLNQILGLRLRVNGVMNRVTRDALRDFQKQEGLPVDGIAGPETKTALQEARSGGMQPAATEFEWEEAPSLAYSPRRVMEQEVGFNSPRRAPRQVRANFVSCNPPSAAIESITGSDPVGTIRRANARAIELLDNAINELQTTRNRVRGGAAADFPTVSDAVSDALQGHFRLDANLRSTWIGTGPRSVLVLIRRLRGARQILADGWMKYTCLGAGTITLGKCRRARGNGCPPDRPNRRAVSCGGHSRIVLCRAWWSDTLDDQAGTLLHECFHIYFGFIVDSGNFGNAHCYEHLVLAVNGLSPQAEFEAACP